MAEFNLWDTEAGSFIGKYADEHSALETVQKLVDHFGPAYAEDLSLGRVADDGSVLAPLTGQDLVARLGQSEESVSREGRIFASTVHRRRAGNDMAASKLDRRKANERP